MSTLLFSAQKNVHIFSHTDYVSQLPIKLTTLKALLCMLRDTTK